MFTEDNILSIKTAVKEKKNEVIKDAITKVTVKGTLFFAIIFIINSFIWIYIACFFIVFRNSQMIALINTLICFGIFMAIPFGYYVIPTILRTFSLNNRESKNRMGPYVFSKILLFLF